MAVGRRSRIHHWELTNFSNSGSTFFSPRVQLSLQPSKKPKYSVACYRLASYTQAPFYKELRDIERQHKPRSVKPQQSFHVVASHERKFSTLGQAFCVSGQRRITSICGM